MVTVPPRPGRSERQSATPQSQACFGPSTVKVGHVNVRTLSLRQAGPGKAECLAAQLQQRDLAVCGLSEIRWPGTGQKRVGQYTIHYSGLATNRAQHGVGIALSPAASQCLMQCTSINERIIIATLKTAITPLTIVQVYAPTDGADADAKDAFYAQLQHQLEQVPEANMLLLMRDFNAKLLSIRAVGWRHWQAWSPSTSHRQSKMPPQLVHGTQSCSG